VLECGGSMLVESVPGEGTTVAIELPSVHESIIADVAVSEII
jgi:signal transduction histidine kinase